MDAKRKVLLVVTKSNFGGAQRYVYDLATHLPRNAFEVAVAFGPDVDGKPGRLSRLLNEKHIRTICIPELARDVNPLQDVHACRALARVLRTEQPDILHLNSSKAGGLGALAGRIAGIRRIIFTSHGLAFDEKRGPFARGAILLATWATMLLAHRTIAIANDTYERARLLPFLRKRLVLIHNGILTPHFLSKTDARKEIRTLDPSIPEDAQWIGSIGELHANKDYATAIEAMTFIESTAHLVVLGDGELHDSLVNHATALEVRDRVHFVGYVPEAARYLRAFDAFLLSSQKEGLPYVLLESGFGYLPVVASDIAGIRDIVLHNFTGLLVRPGNAFGFSEALEKVLADATLARTLSDELLKRVQKVFSLENMIERTARLYTE